MHDALDIRTAPRCLAFAATVARARRPGARRLLLREAFDDWEGARDRALAPA
jgi:hypothetical protein